jgi:iron complex outermembrane receptor protein
MKLLFAMLFTIASISYVSAQTQPDSKPLSKEAIMNLSYEQLLNMPFEELIQLADIVGVSTDELLQMILNKELTSASKKKETAFDSPLSSSVVTAAEIEAAGATTIEEALRLVPGMIVREKTNGVYDVHVRGFDNVPPGNFEHFSENSISLVMVDGQPVYNNISGGTFWETIPVTISQIERIEVIRGASSALYGPNAVSGAINIITKKDTNRKFAVDFTSRQGTHSSGLGDLRISSKINPKVKAFVAANYDVRGRYDHTYYSFLTGQYEELKDSLRNFTGTDYYTGQYRQSLDIRRAKEVYKMNADILYDMASDIQFRVKGGYQHSNIQTAFFENFATPFSARTSKTGFESLQANIKNLSASVMYQNGEQDLSEGAGRPVIKYNMSNLNANVEYDINIGTLSIRPGVNYQKSSYNDSKFIKAMDKKYPYSYNKGLFDGERSTELLAGSLRADYKPFEKLRLIAAVRTDKYTALDDYYTSYQFVASYKLNSSNLVRAVYSQAYRGAFVGDMYSNFNNKYSPMQQTYSPEVRNQIVTALSQSGIPESAVKTNIPYTVNYYQPIYGSEITNVDYKLLGMNMMEIGYRSILSDMIQLDLEAFYQNAKNFDALVDINQNDAQTPTEYYTVSELTGMPLGNTPTALPKTIQIIDTLQYQNLPVKASQIGITGTLNFIFSTKLQVKTFASWQETKLKDYTTNEGKIENRTHKNTPSVYGGININYLPTSDFNIYVGGYFYTQQTYNRYYYLASDSAFRATLKANAEDKIKAKFILNARVSYFFYEKNQVFIEGKNLLFDNNREFGFTDPIKNLILAGVSLSF